MNLYINNKKVENIGYFAFDNCHKIYILENMQDVADAMGCNYYIIPINDLKKCFDNSCGLRFVSSWNLKKHYIKQNENNISIEIN